MARLAASGALARVPALATVKGTDATDVVVGAATVVAPAAPSAGAAKATLTRPRTARPWMGHSATSPGGPVRGGDETGNGETEGEEAEAGEEGDVEENEENDGEEHDAENEDVDIDDNALDTDAAANSAEHAVGRSPDADDADGEKDGESVAGWRRGRGRRGRAGSSRARGLTWPAGLLGLLLCVSTSLSTGTGGASAWVTGAARVGSPGKRLSPTADVAAGALSSTLPAASRCIASFRTGRGGVARASVPGETRSDRGGDAGGMGGVGAAKAASRRAPRKLPKLSGSGAASGGVRVAEIMSGDCAGSEGSGTAAAAPAAGSVGGLGEPSAASASLGGRAVASRAPGRDTGGEVASVLPASSATMAAC